MKFIFYGVMAIIAWTMGQHSWHPNTFGYAIFDFVVAVTFAYEAYRDLPKNVEEE